MITQTSFLTSSGLVFIMIRPGEARGCSKNTAVQYFSYLLRMIFLKATPQATLLELGQNYRKPMVHTKLFHPKKKKKNNLKKMYDRLKS